jgi:hypothetical protein
MSNRFHQTSNGKHFAFSQKDNNHCLICLFEFESQVCQVSFAMHAVRCSLSVKPQIDGYRSNPFPFPSPSLAESFCLHLRASAIRLTATYLYPSGEAVDEALTCL